MEGVRAVGAALQPWSVAVASVLVASGLARGSSWLGLELAVSWFYVATAVTAWLAGRAPGVFASILATALIEYLFIPAHGLTFATEGAANAARLAAFLFVSLLLSRLVSQRNLARGSTQAKDEMLARASHELRGPLNAITTWAALLEHGIAPEKQRQAAQVIRSNAKMTARVAEDLIDVSRIALGEMRFVREHVDLSTLVSNCVASREASACEAGIQLESAITPVVGVEGDPVRLSQVVMNLVGNAIQYTPSGGHVRVTLWQSGAQVVLAVTDTGRGVGAADVERMFKPFVRLGDGGALGVGLAIARHIVQAHGGSIHAASAGQDLGTTVTVAIPASGMRKSIPVHRRRWFHIGGRQAGLPGLAH